MNVRSFVFPMAIIIAGCNSSPPESGVGAQTRSLGGIDFAHPHFIAAPPGARCTFRKPGATASREAIDADAGGKVHFFPPPPSWGSAIDVECSAGSTTKHLSIDLHDPSTFQVDMELAQKVAPTSVRAPLTGDLNAIPLAELLHRGYPPRPDAKRNPERYKQWVEIVSAPRMARGIKMIKALGHQAGNYVATVTDTQEIGNVWSGRAFDVAGWTTTSDADFPIKPNDNNGDWYVQYDTYMTVPPWIRCGQGDNCYGAEWAGMGGIEPRAGITDGSLIQSGIYFTNVGGTPYQTLFGEYAPNAPWLSLPGAFDLHPGDTIEAWGWTSSNSDCADINTTSWTPTACFEFYNMTTNEYAGIAPYDFNSPDGTVYYGWTLESIIENQGPLGALADFGSVTFSDYALAADGNYHSSFTDPWIYINSSDTTPTRLITQVNGSTDDSWYYDVDWLAYR